MTETVEKTISGDGIGAAGPRRRCSVCALESLPALEQLREQGMSRRKVAAQFNVTARALQVHEDAGHHSTLLAERVGVREIDRRIARFKAASLKALKAGDVTAAVAADRYAAELAEKATAAGTGGGWQVIFDEVLRALEAFPEARAAVLVVLEREE